MDRVSGLQFYDSLVTEFQVPNCNFLEIFAKIALLTWIIFEIKIQGYIIQTIFYNECRPGFYVYISQNNNIPVFVYIQSIKWLIKL